MVLRNPGGDRDIAGFQFRDGIQERIKADDRVEGRSGEVNRGRIGPDQGRAGAPPQLSDPELVVDLRERLRRFRQDRGRGSSGSSRYRNRALAEPWMYLHVRR
jgi:hypothetical protein